MTSLINKAKDKLPTNNKSKKLPSGSPERSIPPEPVQQQPHGDFSENDAEPAMQAHNLARANKGCKKVQWSTELAKEAEEYAKTLAKKGKMEHSGVHGQGENLFMSTGNAEFDQAVEAWLSEEKHYNGERIGEGEFAKFGHFTQCLWHGTTHVGMGKAQSKDGTTYVVGRYSPPGNMQGEKPFDA